MYAKTKVEVDLNLGSLLVLKFRTTFCYTLCSPVVVPLIVRGLCILTALPVESRNEHYCGRIILVSHDAPNLVPSHLAR